VKKHHLVIRVEASAFRYDGKFITISVPTDSELKIVPNGTFQGFNWFKPLSVGTIRDMFNLMVEKHGK
jgi:hypothetical protein